MRWFCLAQRISSFCHCMFAHGPGLNTQPGHVSSSDHSHVADFSALVIMADFTFWLLTELHFTNVQVACFPNQCGVKVSIVNLLQLIFSVPSKPTSITKFGGTFEVHRGCWDDHVPTQRVSLFWRLPCGCWPLLKSCGRWIANHSASSQCDCLGLMYKSTMPWNYWFAGETMMNSIDAMGTEKVIMHRCLLRTSKLLKRFSVPSLLYACLASTVLLALMESCFLCLRR